jgi:hypothetical protein
MGKRKQSLDSHVESVNALFDQLNQAAPGESDWLETSTTINLPNAKVASMELRPGYCHLHFHRENVLWSYGPTGQLVAQVGEHAF